MRNDIDVWEICFVVYSTEVAGTECIRSKQDKNKIRRLMKVNTRDSYSDS